MNFKEHLEQQKETNESTVDFNKILQQHILNRVGNAFDAQYSESPVEYKKAMKDAKKISKSIFDDIQPSIEELIFDALNAHL